MGHSHDVDAQSWSEAWASRTMRVVLGALVLALLATMIGAALLWPTSDRDVAEAADDLGLTSDRLSATVDGIRDEPCENFADLPEAEASDVLCRYVSVRLNEGPDSGTSVDLPPLNLPLPLSVPRLSVGDDLVVGYEPSTDVYFYADQDRRGSLLLLFVLFAVVLLAFGRLRGLLALLSMTWTVVVLVGFLGPAVLSGRDPVAVCLVAASAIALVSLLVAHRPTPLTCIALAGTLMALGLAFALSYAFFELAQISGFATEEALILPAISDSIDLSGLLLGGAVLGALGALDDVTVTQVFTVAEVRRADPKASILELFRAGLRVGREHISATVNTLLLAYAGASLPLLLLFSLTDQSLISIANSEIVAIEIVRTLCGSLGLIAAVPITTALAAVVLSRGAAPTVGRHAAPEH